MANSSFDQIPRTLYSMCQSYAPAGKIIYLLRQHEVKILVDVRSSPYSQYNPQFNRETFEQTVKQAGLEYKYAGEFLGGRPKDPTCYKNDQVPDGHVDFLHQVDYPAVMTKEFFLEGIRRLLELAEKDRVAVMCSEEDPAQCPRQHLIGRYLSKQGLTVLHIRGDGNVIKDQFLPNIKEEPPAEQLSLF
jgi:uncharacterized protein (DUF488 family)